ncbi:MAG: hypothetical protein E6K80_09735, partial [Candidatus Eisenbacteria bacterium]
MRASIFLATALALAAVVGAASASSPAGAWTTFIRAREFTALVVDAGQVWGATAEGGLVRWDRATDALEVIRREPGAIASNRLTALAEDRAGRLWVATDGAGVSLRSADGRRWDVVNLLDGLPSDTVRVLEATGDSIWIGTTRGFSLWNGRQVSGSLPDGITTSFDTTFASVSVTGIALRGDSLWIATRRGIGLARLSGQLADWRPMNAGLTDTDVRSLVTDGADVFAQTGADVYRWREDLAQWSLEPGAGVVHRLTNAAGAVLAAGEGGAFRWVHTSTDSGWTAVPGSPTAPPESPDDPEIALARDGRFYAALAETLYAGPPPAGGGWTPRALPDGPPANELLQVEIDGSRVYVTTNTAGVARYDGGWRHWPPVSCNGVECDTTFLRPLFVLGFFADRSGRKWAGCWSQALDSFRDDRAPPQFHHEVIVVDPITQQRSWFVCATQDTSGAVWLGMDTPFKGEIDPIGLEVYDSTGAYRRNYNPTNSNLSGKLVHGLTSTRNGRVWVGFDGDGLDFMALPDTSRFVHVSSTGGLSIRGLASFGDSVWLVTNTQLWRFGAAAATSSQPAQTIDLGGGVPQLGVKPMAVGHDGAVWVG